MRVVLDTNVLIDSFNDDFSAQAKLIDAICRGEITAISTRPIINEYQLLMRRLLQTEEARDRLSQFMAATLTVTPENADVQIDDAEDYKFIQAAVGGEADLLVTSDRHLLQIGEIGSTRIVTPAEAWIQVQQEDDSSQEWEQWASGLGIGRL